MPFWVTEHLFSPLPSSRNFNQISRGGKSRVNCYLFAPPTSIAWVRGSGRGVVESKGNGLGDYKNRSPNSLSIFTQQKRIDVTGSLTRGQVSSSAQ